MSNIVTAKVKIRRNHKHNYIDNVRHNCSKVHAYKQTTEIGFSLIYLYGTNPMVTIRQYNNLISPFNRIHILIVSRFLGSILSNMKIGIFPTVYRTQSDSMYKNFKIYLVTSSTNFIHLYFVLTIEHEIILLIMRQQNTVKI